MKPEVLKRIAELAYTKVKVTIDGAMVSLWLNGDNESSFEILFIPHTNAHQEVRLIRMYREWLDKNTPEGSKFLNQAGSLYHALESTDTLLEAIERDML